MIYIGIVIILIAIIINKLSEKYAFHNLSYDRTASKSTVEIDEEFIIQTTLTNKKWLPITFLKIEERLPKFINYKSKANIEYSVDSLFHTLVMSIMPNQRIKRMYRVSFDRRGRYYFQDIALTAGDFLGLNSFYESITSTMELIVLPKKYSLQDNFIAFGNENGNISVKRWIIDDPTITIGVREYTGFEPQNSIHWASSLKTGELMVRQFDFTTDNTAMILLNLEYCKPFWTGTNIVEIEKCIGAVREIVEEFEGVGIPCGLITNGKVAGLRDIDHLAYPGYGKVHLENVLDALGRIDYSISETFENTMNRLIEENANYSTYVIITPIIHEEYIEVINFLSERCSRMVLITLSKENVEKLNNNVYAYIERSENN